MRVGGGGGVVSWEGGEEERLIVKLRGKQTRLGEGGGGGGWRVGGEGLLAWRLSKMLGVSQERISADHEQMRSL